MLQAQSTQPVFNAVKYKQASLEQWNNAAEAWHRWDSLLTRWLGPATQTMLSMAGVSGGSKVLGVAAGAGEQTLATARRVGTHTVDGECLQFEQESFSALHPILSGLSDTEKEEAREEIEQTLQRFETDQQFVGPCQMPIAVGTR